MDDRMQRVVTSRRNFNIASRVLDTTSNPDLLEGHATEYLKAREEHAEACDEALQALLAAEHDELVATMTGEDGEQPE